MTGRNPTFRRSFLVGAIEPVCTVQVGSDHQLQKEAYAKDDSVPLGKPAFQMEAVENRAGNLLRHFPQLRQFQKVSLHI